MQSPMPPNADRTATPRTICSLLPLAILGLSALLLSVPAVAMTAAGAKAVDLPEVVTWADQIAESVADAVDEVA